MITFTIITCTYNAAGTLRRTLDSVQAQTYPHVEHLIIDGASRDDTPTMVCEYKCKSEANDTGHSVVTLSEPDNGLYDAMNKGIGLATGDYLVFLNSGDVFPANDTLDIISSRVNDGDALPGVLYGDTDIIDNNGIFIRHRRLSPPSKLTWRSFKYGMLVCHQAFYANTRLAKNVLYDLEYKFSADVDWCVRVMKEAEKEGLEIRYLHAVVVNYLDGGMSVTNRKASLRERFKLMTAHYGLFTTLLTHFLFILRALVKR